MAELVSVISSSKSSVRSFLIRGVPLSRPAGSAGKWRFGAQFPPARWIRLRTAAPASVHGCTSARRTPDTPAAPCATSSPIKLHRSIPRRLTPRKHAAAPMSIAHAQSASACPSDKISTSSPIAPAITLPSSTRTSSRARADGHHQAHGSRRRHRQPRWIHPAPRQAGHPASAAPRALPAATRPPSAGESPAAPTRRKARRRT